MRREDSIFSISDRLTEVLAKETLTDDLDRKWFLNTRAGPCCLWPPPCLLLVISVTQIILYLYNSVAEHPLVLHPIKFHEPWRYITYFLGRYNKYMSQIWKKIVLMTGTSELTDWVPETQTEFWKCC